MKKNILVFFTLLAVCILSITFIRCSNDTEGDVKLTQGTLINQKSDAKEVYVQKIKLLLADNSEVEGQMTFTLDGDTGDLVDLKFSDELLDSSTGIDPIKFQAELQTYGEHSDCMKACKNEFIDPNTGKVKNNPETGEPMSGYGACKFNCWVDTSVRVLVALAPIIAAAAL